MIDGIFYVIQGNNKMQYKRFCSSTTELFREGVYRIFTSVLCHFHIRALLICGGHSCTCFYIALWLWIGHGLCNNYPGQTRLNPPCTFPKPLVLCFALRGLLTNACGMNTCRVREWRDFQRGSKTFFWL